MQQCLRQQKKNESLPANSDGSLGEDKAIRNPGPPPLPQSTAAPTFGGGASFGSLNQQGSSSSTASTTAGSAFTFGSGGNTGTAAPVTSTGGFGTPQQASTGGTTFGGTGRGTGFGGQPAVSGVGGSLFGSTSGGSAFGGTQGGAFGTQGGAFGGTQGGAFGGTQGGAFGGTQGGAFGGTQGGAFGGASGGGLFGNAGGTDSDDDNDINATQPAQNTFFAQQPQRAAPCTWFYLVCGGEFIPQKEKQSREQMSLIADVIIRKGMATKDHIVFVHGRGQNLNNSVKRNFVAVGNNFKLYGPHVPQQGGLFFGGTPQQSQQKKCPFPRKDDNAVVIFIGQGKYYQVANNSFGFGGTAPPAPTDTFGELLFINSAGFVTMYSPSLRDLRAKNTLFISLADYSGEAFRRGFEVTFDARRKKMFVLCMSDNLHSANDHCLASAFSEFFDGEDWKNSTIEDFTQVVQDKFVHHPELEKKRDEVVQYTEATYNQKVKETAAWATGQFGNLVHKPIPAYDWAMFQEVEELSKDIDDANVGELSTNMKEKLDRFIDSMGQLRLEAIQHNLHLPKAFEAVGDDDVSTMTWRDFLMLKD